MNLYTLQEEIIANPEHIATILEKLGHEDIKDRGSYYQAKNIGGDNPSGCAVRKEDLIWSNFSHSKSGSIWSMVQDEADCNFREALELVGKWIGVKDEFYRPQRSITPFPGWFEEVKKAGKDTLPEPKTYDEKLLPSPLYLSDMFDKDGVSPETQLFWGVRYDPATDGVIIPWTNISGELIGAKWRNNNPLCKMDERWNMYLKFSVSLALYGWRENYDTIVNKKKLYIFEAEKSVMQLYDMGCQTGIAVGGHNISDVQMTYINALMPKEIVVAFDAGLPEGEVKYAAEKIKLSNKKVGVKVGYIYDPEGAYLNGKDSPTDNGKEKFEEIIENCVHWL